MPRSSLILVLAAVALAGCGPAATSKSAKDFSGPKKDVAQAIDDFSKAARNGDEKELCTSVLSRRRVQALETGRVTCADAVNDQLDAAGDYKIDVKAITISGTTATASVVSKRSGDDARQTLTLVREAGRWRLDGVR